MYTENEAFQLLLKMIEKYVRPGPIRDSLSIAARQKHSKYVLAKFDDLGVKPQNQIEKDIIKSAFFYAE